MSEVERLLTAALVDIDVIDPAHRHAQHCLQEYYRELDRRFDAGFDPHRHPRRGSRRSPCAARIVPRRHPAVGAGRLRRPPVPRRRAHRDQAHVGRCVGPRSRCRPPPADRARVAGDGQWQQGGTARHQQGARRGDLDVPVRRVHRDRRVQRRALRRPLVRKATHRRRAASSPNRTTRGSSTVIRWCSHRRISPRSRPGVITSTCSMSSQSFGRSNATSPRRGAQGRGSGSRDLRTAQCEPAHASRRARRRTRRRGRSGWPPPHARLTIAFDGRGRRRSLDAEGRQHIEHVAEPAGRDEHVDVDVDRRPRFRVIGQRHGAAERVRDVRGVERVVQEQDLVGETCLRHGPRPASVLDTATVRVASSGVGR